MEVVTDWKAIRWCARHARNASRRLEAFWEEYDDGEPVWDHAFLFTREDFPDMPVPPPANVLVWRWDDKDAEAYETLEDAEAAFSEAQGSLWSYYV